MKDPPADLVISSLARAEELIMLGAHSKSGQFSMVFSMWRSMIGGLRHCVQIPAQSTPLTHLEHLLHQLKAIKRKKQLLVFASSDDNQIHLIGCDDNNAKLTPLQLNRIVLEGTDSTPSF